MSQRYKSSTRTRNSRSKADITWYTMDPYSNDKTGSQLYKSADKMIAKPTFNLPPIPQIVRSEPQKDYPILYKDAYRDSLKHTVNWYPKNVLNATENKKQFIVESWNDLCEMISSESRHKLRSLIIANVDKTNLYDVSKIFEMKNVFTLEEFKRKIYTVSKKKICQSLTNYYLHFEI